MDILSPKLLIAPLLLVATLARAQPARQAPAASHTVPPASPALPQQTTATFGDWVLRCVRPGGVAKQCEVVQLVQQDGKPVAQLAIGSAAKGKPMVLAVLVPPSIDVGTAPSLQAAGNDGPVLALAWRRCLPGGCLADGEIGPETLQRVSAWTQAGRVAFTDGVGRGTAVPVAPQGLAQALEALGKEPAS